MAARASVLAMKHCARAATTTKSSSTAVSHSLRVILCPHVGVYPHFILCPHVCRMLACAGCACMSGSAQMLPFAYVLELLYPCVCVCRVCAVCHVPEPPHHFGASDGPGLPAL